MKQENVLFPGKRLLDPANYGNEEYLVLFLSLFIVFVAIKHAIFHTFYFWWYKNGRFYILETFWNFITRKSLSKRLLNFVRMELGNKESVSVIQVKNVVNEYFQTQEFSPSLGVQKGKIVSEIVTKYQPGTSLVIGCHLGYVLLELLVVLPDNAIVITIESNPEFISTSKALLELAGQSKKVTFLCGDAIDVLPCLKNDYNISQFDFVFLNRTKLDMPSHVPILKDMETQGYFHSEQKEYGSNRTVILADKVVMPGDSEYLLYVRLSEKYETKYQQVALEHSSEEIVDGMELAIYQG